MEPLSTVGQRLRSPVTWGSAAATLAGLYGLYQYQYQRQLARQRTSGRPDLGGPFSLLDPDGKPVRSADLHGRWVLLYFGFTKCPDICPDELDKVRTVLERLEGRGRDVLPVFITIDPDRDTRPRLKTYFADHDFHPKTLALTGSHEVRRARAARARTPGPAVCDERG
jgi:protein SCO1/2